MSVIPDILPKLTQLGYWTVWSQLLKISPPLAVVVLANCGSFLSPDGTISSSSILLAQSLQHCVHSQNCSATDLFYQGSSQTVREWLHVAITRTLHQGEESLLELTKQICSFLQVKVKALRSLNWAPIFIGCLVDFLEMTLFLLQTHLHPSPNPHIDHLTLMPCPVCSVLPPKGFPVLLNLRQ